ncbi:anthranilate synthase component I [Psychromicrobium xiongbiense]|uniref:anthranilate synthase component I n=1 Tax=Psychromicrobium xiongbiense TaxID=3051184 RepID=UPI0025553CAB|nr:anthranilate synthase component I [Psychromicrobium sp. YIM S02556]
MNISVTPGNVTPSLEEFRVLAQAHRVIPVRLRVLADSQTPIGLYRALAGGAPGTFLLESAAPGGVWSQHSFIGVRSSATLTSRGSEVHWQGTPPEGVPLSGSPVDALARTVELLHTERLEGLPPLTSGMVGFLGWESVRHWEKLPTPPVDDLGLPELAFNLVSDLAVHDNTDGSVLLIANAINFDGGDERVDEAWHDAVARIEAMLAALQSAPVAPVTVPVDSAQVRSGYRAQVRETWDEAEYLAAIKLGKEAIVDGEVFQVVVSRRFEMATQADPLDIYRMLRVSNPSPYMYLFNFTDPEGEDYTIVGSSPEALVTVSGTEVITHPIAGSRPRGRTTEEDQSLEQDLLADEKERAEHLMLVDLSRNDISKVCLPGSVEVTQFMEVERFSHIMHLVSTVVGTLAPEKTAYDTLAATFPAGTLSGAPKPRAMRLLDELEPQRRGLYGGIVGYLDFSGNMDAAISIRTALLRGGTAYVQAGGGIVADSQETAEALETVNKAAAPLQAVYAAELLHQRAAEAGLAASGTRDDERDAVIAGVQ